MKTHWKSSWLLLGAFALAMFATLGTNPALARSSDGAVVSQHMKVKAHKRAHRRFLSASASAAASAVGTPTAGVAAAAVTVTPAAKPGTGESSSSGACPSSLSGFLPANNVDASYTNAGNKTTYKFESLVPERQSSSGVPGLVKYCVYTNSPKAPNPVEVSAEVNGQKWLARTSKKSGDFAFVRPGGNSTNIPLDGRTTTMGTATWETLPAEPQKILLHINDPNECTRIYGAGTSLTCFVLPKEGPICDQGTGNTEAAYNSMPTDFPPACFPPPAEAFQAQQVSEFGDDVTLGKGGSLQSMVVDFQSYACEEGNWFETSCKSEPGKVWNFANAPNGPHVITASIYNLSDPTTPVATATASPDIPFRPSWNSEKCVNPGTDANGGNDLGKWFNSANGYCVYSISDPIEFTNFTGTQTSFKAGETVIWTVAFDTSTWGYHPIGEVGPWDSLNVGDYTYPNAPYAGLNPTPEKIWLAQSTNTEGNLGEGEIECPLCGPSGENLFTKDLLPLAEITTSGP